MTRLQLKLMALILFLLGSTLAAQAQTTYWLASRDGDQLRFEVQVPPDAVKLILHKDKAPKGGDDTTPRYRTFTHTIDGKDIRFHSNELGWETPKLQDGSFTWVTGSGMGADWKGCNTKDALWPDFADALASLATSAEGWSSAKVIIAESSGKEAPNVRLNLDGSAGTPSEEKVALWRLADLTSKEHLSSEELEEARGFMLTVANAGRANPGYRREMGSKTALNLPKNLKPLELDEKLNEAAQHQAEYCAKVKEPTHDQDDPKYATLGDRLKLFTGSEIAGAEAAGAGGLQDYPTGWMKSETHYRPFWNLEGPITHVGFGIAKGSDGNWYVVAVFVNQ